MKLWSLPEFFYKTCLTNNYLSRDPQFVILAWVQSWNIYEKLMELWSPPDFFHKNMSYEQLPFMWSTLHRYGFCLWRMQRHYIFTIHLSTCHCHKHLSQVAINLQNRFYFPNAVGVAVVFVAIAIWSWSLLYLSIVVLYPQCESFAHSVQCLNISFSYTVPFAFEKTAVFLLHKSWTLRGDNAVIQDSAVTI